MDHTTYSDGELIEAIKTNSERLGPYLEQLYAKQWPSIRNLVCKNSGSEDDAKDIFQEAIYIFVEKVKNKKADEPGGFRPDASVGSFLYAIARHTWLNQLRRKGYDHRFRDTQMHVVETYEPAPDSSIIKDEVKAALHEAMQELDESCRKLLIGRYFERKANEELTEELGFSNANVTKSRMWKCKQKLSAILDSMNFEF